MDYFFMTALHDLINLGETNLYRSFERSLAENHHDINTQDDNGDTALHLASKKGYIEICNLLIMEGADIGIRNNSNETPFEVKREGFWGVFSTNPLVSIKSKIIKVAETNSFSTDNQACRLFANMAKSNYFVGEANNIIDIAVQHKNEAFLTQLLYVWRRDQPDLLHDQIGLKLLKIGFNNQSSFPAIKALDIYKAAAQANHTEIIQLLIENHLFVDYHKRDLHKYINDFFEAAANNNHTEFIQFLSKNFPAQVLEIYKTAAVSNDFNRMNMLIDCNALPAIGESLLLAAEYGHTSACKYLLDMGVPLLLPGIFKKPAIHNALLKAAENGHTETSELLIERGAWKSYYEFALMAAAQNGHTQTCKLLINFGANVNQVHGKKSALIAAAENGHTETCELLINQGADVQCRGGMYYDSTALSVAKNANICYLLIKNGAIIYPIRIFWSFQNSC